MVDVSVPNLCGANTELNKLMSQYDDIKNLLVDKLEESASDLADALGVDTDILDVDLKKLVPKLPALPATNLQSEITSLVGMGLGSAGYVSKLADIAGKFGTGLSAGGYDLNSLVSGAVSDLASGLDLCGGVPNFELPAGATQAVEKAKAALQPTVESAAELLSVAVLELNPAVSEAKAAVAAKVASFSAEPSTVEGVISGAFKTATKTESITFASGVMEAVTFRNAISTFVETNIAENIAGAITSTSTLTKTSTTRSSINQSGGRGGLLGGFAGGGVRVEDLREPDEPNKVVEQTVKAVRSNFAPAGFTSSLERYTDVINSSKGELTHQPARIASVLAYGPDWPTSPKSAAGRKGRKVKHISEAMSLMSFGMSSGFAGGGQRTSPTSTEWYYENNGKNISIVDHNGSALGSITKIRVRYSYPSNYDPRFKAEA